MPLQLVNMEYRRLGSTGLKVSELCLGTMTFLWTADEATSLAIVSEYIHAGGNFIDTADIYSRWAPNNPGGTAESLIGKWLSQFGSRRDQVVIATKAQGPMGSGPNDQGSSRVHLINAVNASLKRMNTDFIDLFQLHWADFATPLEETLRTLDDLVSAGKIRYIGVSNYPSWYLMKAQWISDVRHLVRFECLQPHYNLMHRHEFEDGLQAACLDQKLGVMPYSPLAGGYLTGKYRRGQPIPSGTRGETNDRIRRYMDSDSGEVLLNKLAEIGKVHQKSVPQTALAWLLSNPVITSPIIGANSVPQLQNSLAAVGYRLNTDEMISLNTITASAENN